MRLNVPCQPSFLTSRKEQSSAVGKDALSKLFVFIINVKAATDPKGLSVTLLPEDYFLL